MIKSERHQWGNLVQHLVPDTGGARKLLSTVRASFEQVLFNKVYLLLLATDIGFGMDFPIFSICVAVYIVEGKKRPKQTLPG